MNSKQRRKANKAYKTLQDFVVVRLRINGDVSEEEIADFLKQPNFLLKRPAPNGTYWRHLTNAARSIGLSHFVKAQHGRN